MFRDMDVRIDLLPHLKALFGQQKRMAARSVRRSVRANLLFALATMLVIPTPASARASGMSTNYWSAERVALLPAEIRSRIEKLGRACGVPLRAGEQFERSIRDPRSGGEILALHLHDLQCDKRIFCTGHGCLREVYAQGP